MAKTLVRNEPDNLYKMLDEAKSLLKTATNEERSKGLFFTVDTKLLEDRKLNLSWSLKAIEAIRSIENNEKKVDSKKLKYLCEAQVPDTICQNLPMYIKEYYHRASTWEQEAAAKVPPLRKTKRHGYKSARF